MFKGCGGIYGRYQTGDAVLNLGEYIAMLATEYKLLNDANQDVTPTANELYYALNAVNRLDLFGEEFFNKDAKEDGFFVREDWPANMFKIITANEVDDNGVLLADPIADHHSLQENLYNFQRSNREAGPTPINDNWQSQYPNITSVQVKDALYDGVEVVYEVDENKECSFSRDDYPVELNKLRDNEMSQDQIYGLIMGFYAVKKFVPSNAGARPNPSIGDNYINFHAWAEVLCDRILTFVSKQKTVNNATVILNEDEDYRIVTVDKLMTTWFINNPSNGGEQVKRGMNMWIYAEPLARIGKEITGKTYSTDIVVHFPKAKDRVKVLWNTSYIGILDNGCKAVQAGSASKHKADNTEYKRINMVVDCVKGASAGGVAAPFLVTTLFPIKLWTAYTGDVKLPSSENLWKIALYSATQSDNTLGSQMTIKLAAMDPLFNSSSLSQPLTLKGKFKNFVATQIGGTAGATSNVYYNKFSNLFEKHLKEKEFYNLLPNTYHPGHSTKTSKKVQLDFLSSAPCDGTGKTQSRAVDASFPTIWMHGDLFSLSKQKTHRDSLKPEETGGVQFMLLHNLYRIAYADEIDDIYKEETCPCASTALIRHREITHPHYVYEMGNKYKLENIGRSHYKSVEVTPRKFSDYADIGIPKPFYVSHDVEIKDQGKLHVAGDLTVCGSEMEVKAGGEVFIPNTDPDYPTTLEVDNGGRLSFEPNSRLTVGDKSRLLISSAGVLEVFRDVTITLDGPEANLIIEGELILRDNAKLTIQGGPNGLGFVTIRKNKNPDNGNETFATITAGSNSSIEIEGANKFQKVLLIDGNFGAIIPYDLAQFTVKNGKIELGRLSRLQVACPVTIENCNIRTINESKDYWYYAGIITIGQPGVLIKDCDIEQGHYGVLAQNYFYPHSKPRIEGCTFENMTRAIQVDGGGIDVSYTTANRNSWSMVATGVNTDCVFEEVYFNQSKPNMFTGSSSGVLNWFQGSITNGYNDGIAIIGTTFKPKCVKIQYNDGHGIYTRGASYLPLSARLDAGYNYFTANSEAGIFNYEHEGDLFGQGKGIGVGIDLVDGFNSFKDNGTYALDAIINPSSITVLNGRYFLASSNNYWGTSNPPANAVDYTTYLKHNWGSPLLRPDIETSGNHLTSSYRHLVGQVGVCFQGMVLPPDKFSDVTRDECTDMSQDAISDNTAIMSYETGRVQLYEDENYESAMSAFREVMLYDFQCTDSAFQHNLAYRSYKGYMMAYSKRCTQTDATAGEKIEFVNSTIDLINELIADASSESSLWKSHQFMLNIDLADCYRTKDSRQESIRIYDALLASNTSKTQQDLINYYRCIAESEQRVLNHEISIYDKIEQYACIPPISDYATINESTPSKNAQEETEGQTPSSNLQIIVYPNPTKGLCVLNTNDELKTLYEGNKAVVTVSDAYGLPIYEFEDVSVSESLEIDLKGYKAGIYSIRYRVGSSVLTSYIALKDQ